jgi:penicillin amidase
MSGITGNVLKLLLLTALLLALSIYLSFRASLPAVSGARQVSGLGAPVTVVFDQWQRPYVQAASMADALRAQGWLHADNRLWQMELFRRAGKGRLAELLGPSMLEADRELWRVGIPRLGMQLARNASPALLGQIDAYLQGVNSAIAGKLLPPPEFLLLASKPLAWTREDVFALGALMAFQSAGNFKRELLRLALLQKLGEERFRVFITDGSQRGDYPTVLPGQSGAQGINRALDRMAHLDPAQNPLLPRFAFGSNGWVIAPGKSASGRALFAFDSHDSLGLPSLFYEVHLFFDGGKQIRGWSVAGLPGVINGYNERIAWGFTNIGDTQDLFLETRSAARPLQFREGDGWYTAETETVHIPVRGEPPAELTITHTRNGPLISEDPPLSLRWTIQDLGELGLDALLALNRARDWREFNAALDRYPAPSLNATYADVEGNIGFRTAGLLPDRGAGEGLYPLAGADPANRWQGLVPAADMPRRRNPPERYLAAANSRVNPPGAYPLVSADNAAPYRIHRLQQVLGQERKFTREDMASLQVDWHDSQAGSLLPQLLPVLEAMETTATEAAALSLLVAWQADPVASPGSAAALIFQHYYPELAREVFAGPLGPELFARTLKSSYLLNYALDELLRRPEDPHWWLGHKPEKIRAAFRRTVAGLAGRLGPQVDAWRLDQLQSVALPHELGKAIRPLAWFLNTAPRPWGGGPATLGRANYRYDRPHRVSHAATVRVVAEMGTSIEAAAVMAGGQSGHPLSGHYADQFPAWLEGALLPIQRRVGTPARAISTLQLQESGNGTSPGQ